jgi:hypothetical protein
MSASEAKALLAGLTAGGNTNYDAALDTARGAFTDSGHLTGGQNVAYFFSDGRPNLPTSDVGIDAGEARVWQDFLNQHDIQSYAIGLGRDVPVSALEPVAWNGVTGADDLPALVVSQFSQLDAVLADTVTPALSGDVVDGGLRSVLGADGGHLSEVIVDGVRHPWDPTTSASDTLTVKTNAGGEFTIDMETGHYTYQAPGGTRSDYQEILGFTLTDGDGDTRPGQLTLNLNADGSASFNGACAPAPTPTSGCHDGGVLSWTLADACTTNTTSATSGSGCGDGLQLSDLLGYRSQQDPLSSWSGSGGSGCSTSTSTSTSTAQSTSTYANTSSCGDNHLLQTLLKQTVDTLPTC